MTSLRTSICCIALLLIGLGCGSTPSSEADTNVDDADAGGNRDIVDDAAVDADDFDATDANADLNVDEDTPPNDTGADLGGDADAEFDSGEIDIDGDSDIDADADIDADSDIDASDAEDVAPNGPPTLGSESPAYGRVGVEFRHGVDVSDPDADPVVVTVTEGTRGVVFDAERSELAWLPGEADGGIHEIRLEADDGRAAVEITVEVRISSASLVAMSEVAISDTRVPPEASPPEPTRRPVQIVATPGEFEPASLRLYATDRAVEGLSVELSALRADGVAFPPDAVEVRSVRRWFQAGTDHRKTDARLLVPELLLRDAELVRSADGRNEVRLIDGTYLDISESGELDTREAVDPADLPIRDAEEFVPIDIAAGTNEALWLTVAVPDDQPPGVYTGEVVVREGDEPLEWIPLRIEVLPFTLEPSPITQSVYYRAQLSEDWPGGTISSEFKSEEQLAAELSNMMAHGLTNPTIYQRADTDLFERYLEIRAEAGMAGQPIYLVRENAIFFRRTLEEFTEHIGEVIDRATAAGATDVYFMGRDEARAEDLEAQRPAWEAVRAAGGRVWAAGYRSTAWRGPGNHEIMGDVQDLLICAFRPSRHEAALWHGSGAEIFVYENPQGGLEFPEMYRRDFGLLLWQEDYDGAMTYAWQDSFGNGWNDFDHERMRDFNFTYPTVDGVIDTIQWEGYREGIDDLRYVATLLRAIDEAEPENPARASAVSWVEAMRALPLGRTDLGAVRDTTIGHILNLSGVAPDTSAGLIVEDFELGGWRDGGLLATWATSERTTSWLEWGRAPDSFESASSDSALRRFHSANLGIELDEGPVYVRAVAHAADGALATSETIAVDLESALDLAFLPPTPEDGAAVSAIRIHAEVQSPARSSVFFDVDRSLLGWWRFDGDAAADSSSWTRTSSLQNGAGELGAGWFGDGLVMDGVDDHLAAGDLDIPENGTATVEAWIRLDAFPVDAGGPIGLFSQVYLHPVNDHLYFRSTNDWFRSSSVLTVGAWHHLAVSWSGDSATARLWIDGRELPMNVQGDPEDIGGFEDFRVGRSFGHFDGTIDEVRVWSRALSASEVRASYDAGRANPIRFDFEDDGGPVTLRAAAVDARGDWLELEERTIAVE